MPLVRIALAGTDPTLAQVADLQRRMTALMADLLGKQAGLTVVTVERQPAAGWSVGGVVPAGGAVLAHVEAFITAGTNSAAQKAAFVRAAHDALATVLGPLASPTYVLVQELPAGDWGYDGATQAARRAASTTTTPRTLRGWAVLPPATALPTRDSALLLIDYQREYLDGCLPLTGVEAAVARARVLMAWADAAGLPVIHVHHVAARADAPLFAPGSEGVLPIPGLEPAPRHRLLHKGMPSCFHGTGLEELLRELQVKTLVLAGFATHMCVDTTTRDAVHRGFQAVVVADACASRPLPGTGGQGGPEALDGDTLHRASLAALADRFADVVTLGTV